MWAATLVAASLLPVPESARAVVALPGWKASVDGRPAASFDAGVRSPIGQTPDIIVRANGVEDAPRELPPSMAGVADGGDRSGGAAAGRRSPEACPVGPVGPAGARRTLGGTWRARSPTRYHLRCTPLLLQSALCAVPMTWGVRRPQVLNARQRHGMVRRSRARCPRSRVGARQPRRLGRARSSPRSPAR